LILLIKQQGMFRLKFNSWVSKQNKDDPNTRLVYDTIRSNHDFPNTSSLSTIKVYCRKKGIGNDIISAFTVMFEKFRELPYATIYERATTRKRPTEKLRLG
jgi:hypothetical protein